MTIALCPRTCVPDGKGWEMAGAAAATASGRIILRPARRGRRPYARVVAGAPPTPVPAPQASKRACPIPVPRKAKVHAAGVALPAAVATTERTTSAPTTERVASKGAKRAARRTAAAARRASAATRPAPSAAWGRAPAESSASAAESMMSAESRAASMAVEPAVAVGLPRSDRAAFREFCTLWGNLPDRALGVWDSPEFSSASGAPAPELVHQMGIVQLHQAVAWAQAQQRIAHQVENAVLAELKRRMETTLSLWHPGDETSQQ
ncbi:PREDICTED: predicted GPI-anchored protein 58 isoform X2 [Priapulus caudatus]|uniref:Predicted GPI-anchored protein 58 isoform X2 n=2 Tax=Priapulus caudatus TaxID=37621 RepID=A0ABM1EHB4_PRICU|nr:PREDICTED: predicted GPI-anchored protein 58 isoform X2 [Priapulus caudatus]